MCECKVHGEPRSEFHRSRGFLFLSGVSRSMLAKTLHFPGVPNYFPMEQKVISSSQGCYCEYEAILTLLFESVDLI